MFVIFYYKEEPNDFSHTRELAKQWVNKTNNRGKYKFNRATEPVRAGLCTSSGRPALLLRGSNCCLFFLQLGDVLPGNVAVHDLAVFEVKRYKDLTLWHS